MKKLIGSLLAGLVLLGLWLLAVQAFGLIARMTKWAFDLGWRVW